MSDSTSPAPHRSRRLLAGLVTVVGVGASIAVPVITAGASRGADDRPATDGTDGRRGRGLDDAATSTVATVPTSITVTVPTVPMATVAPTVLTVPTAPTIAPVRPGATVPSTTIDDHGRRHGGRGADDGVSTTVPRAAMSGSPSTTWDDRGGDRDRSGDDDSGRGRGRGRGGDDDGSGHDADDDSRGRR